jgi:hypothetical protein
MAVLATFPKQPDEIQDYDMDFSEWLTSVGDTALSVIATTDIGITQEFPASISSGVVKIWLSGGADGTTYKVTATVTTTGGRVKQAEIKIKIKEY